MAPPSYEIFNWDKDGNLIDHESYNSAWDLLKDWPYGNKELDVCVSHGGQTYWTSVEELREDYEDNSNG